MDAVHEFVARAAPLPRSDVDTDQIIPSEWLKRVERTGFGAGLFSEWRERSDFVLNQARYAEAQILVAGPNFGTGSSREHAVWALMDYGFRAVISSRFADIFRNNALKQGLVPVTVPEPVAHTILAAVEDDAATEIVIDVVHRRVAVPVDRPRRAVRARRLLPAPPRRGPRRHRDHRAERRRHRRVRGRPACVPAVDHLSP